MKVEILRLDNFGRGIAYYNDKICFIENAYPEEIVEFEISKETNKYIEGKAINIIRKSPFRINSKCVYSDICGGCTFQEYDYQEENKYKENKIRGLVERALHLDSNIVKDIVYDIEINYRNKLILHGNNNKLGLYKNKTNEIIDIEECNISNNKINKIIKILRKINNIEEVLIRTSNDEKEVIVDIKNEVNNYEELLKECTVLIINNKIITKKDKIITTIGDKKYYLSSNSFFQVNENLTEKLFDKVKEYIINIEPTNVLDLYCGTGSFGIYISDIVKTIVGVDYNESNINDAKNNNKLNNINNIKYICDKVENVIDTFKNYDLVIVDPPRAGLDKKSIDNIIKINPKNIIYISCDPNTLIRDLNILKEKYKIKEITPYNLFPKTYHCESIVVLERK